MNILLLSSVSLATAQNLKAGLTPRDGTLLDTLYMKAIPALDNVEKRDQVLAEPPMRSFSERGVLELRQMSCLPGEVTCAAFNGCCLYSLSILHS
jgi:hypothetical protein